MEYYRSFHDRNFPRFMFKLNFIKILISFKEQMQNRSKTFFSPKLPYKIALNMNQYRLHFENKM